MRHSIKFYISAVLFLQCFVSKLNLVDTTPTGTERAKILPESCGYTGLELTLVRQRRSTRPVSKVVDHPWQAAIVNTDKSALTCGGSIISDQHILTAASCFVDPVTNGVISDRTTPVNYTKYTIVVGSSNYEESQEGNKIKQLYIHGRYSPKHRRNDIALIKIDGKFTWNERTLPICLPAENETVPNELCTVTGYGNLNPEFSNSAGLLQSERVVRSILSFCKRFYKNRSIEVTDGMFCAALYMGKGVFEDMCQGDTGGPLYCGTGMSKSVTRTEFQERKLMGVTSVGHMCGSTNDPGLYTMVSKYLPWIRDRLEVSIGYREEKTLPPEVDIRG